MWAKVPATERGRGIADSITSSMSSATQMDLTDVEVVRDGISEEDAFELEDVLMKEHAESIINLQNIHGPTESSMLMAYSDAMSAFNKQRNLAMVFTAECKTDEAFMEFEKAYASYLVCRDNAAFESQLKPGKTVAKFSPKKSFARLIQNSF